MEIFLALLGGGVFAFLIFGLQDSIKAVMDGKVNKAKESTRAEEARTEQAKVLLETERERTERSRLELEAERERNRHSV